MRAPVIIAAACASCTLVVENQLSSQSHESVDAGPCDELVFLDGVTPTSGQMFHNGVTAPAFRGPAYPPANKTPEEFGSTLAFVLDGGVMLVGGYQGDQVGLRYETNYPATWVVPAPGHQGPDNFGCSEVLAASYDTLRDRTSYQLLGAGCNADNAFDGGSFAGPPDPNGPALGWAGSPDGGARIAVVFASLGQECDEIFPLSCYPPHGGAVAPSAGRRVDALSDAAGGPLWIVSTEGSDTRVYGANFFTNAVVVSWAGPVAALALDIGVTMRIHSGQLEAQLFNNANPPSKIGNEIHFDLADSAAHALEISRLGTAPILRAAWVGGDGQARIASVDFTVASAPRLSPPALVCGSQGATFVAPTSTTTAAVLIGDALYLRRVP